MFVTVKYGDDRQQLINANCRNSVLLNYIKQKCNLHAEDVVELSDETGVVKNLRHFPNEYGSDFLKERETLILLRVQAFVDRDGEISRTKYVPMVSGLDGNSAFNDTLNPIQERRDSGSRFGNRSQRNSLELDEAYKGMKTRKSGTKSRQLSKRNSSRFGMKK